jgi:hypothetical protein
MDASFFVLFECGLGEEDGEQAETMSTRLGSAGSQPALPPRTQGCRMIGCVQVGFTRQT